MEGLKRSEISFRRQGSSGLVWEDRFISGELKKNEELQNQKQQQQGGGKDEVEFRELRPSRSVGSLGLSNATFQRSRTSNGAAARSGAAAATGGGGGGAAAGRGGGGGGGGDVGVLGGGGAGHRTGKVSPALDPPSPKVSACGFCSVFGKSHNQKPKHRSKTTKTAGKRKS